MPYRNWPELPGERRCVNCDQRLIAEGQPAEGTAELALPPTVSYVCPDDHERWAYDSQSQLWRQMY